MHNDEIRLALLAQYYRAMLANKCGMPDRNPSLKGISEPVINANMYYLIDKGLIDGTIQYMGSNMLPLPSVITAHGMDVIEEIMDKSLVQ